MCGFDKADVFDAIATAVRKPPKRKTTVKKKTTAKKSKRKA